MEIERLREEGKKRIAEQEELLRQELRKSAGECILHVCMCVCMRGGCGCGWVGILGHM